MGFKTAICLISFGLAATCLAQIPERFFIESKVDGRILAVVDEYAPPTGGPYQRYGVVPVNKNSSNIDFWGLDAWGQDANVGTIYPTNSTSHNSLTTGLPCDQCFSYTHTHDVSPVSDSEYRLLRIVDGIAEPNTCVKHSGEGQFITEVVCNGTDDSQLWFFRDVGVTQA